MSATIKDVAERAGVSIATVSRCYNNTGYVSDEAKKAIKKAAHELNYSPKKYKQRRIPESTSDVIGVVVTEINNPFFTSVINAVEQIADKHGKTIMICDSQEKPKTELRHLEMLRTRVGGLIIAPTSQVAYYNAEYIKELNDKVMPVVLLDREVSVPQLDGVFVDSFRGAYDGLQVLIDNGHRDIAIIAGPTTSKPGLERLNGYLEILKDNDIPIREEYILYGEFSEELAYSLTKKLIHTQKAVTAIFSSNINMSFGCIKAIYDQGMTIPDDMAYIGFDDYPLFDINALSLSVLQNPGYQLGIDCATWLVNRMDKHKRYKDIPVRRIILMPKLILRGSEKFPKNRL